MGILALIVVGVLLSGCAPKEQGKVIKVGVLADLTGDYASFLRGAPRGAELAKADIEKELGVPIKLLIEDQKSCDAKETVSIMQKFTSIDHVDFIIGSTCSSTTLAAAPIANAAHTPLISPASSAPSISKAGEYVFRTYISDVVRAEKSAELAYKLGYRRMAIFKDISNDATIELADAGKKQFEALGGSVVAEEEINAGTDVDFRTLLLKIKEVQPDVLYLSVMGPKQIALIAKQARELGINAQLIMPGETVQDQHVIDIAGNAVEGLIYVLPHDPSPTPRLKHVEEAYEAKYNESVPSYTLEAYDAMWLGVKAVLASDGAGESVKDKLYEVSKEYEGVSGNVTFDENGDVHKAVQFMQIKDGKFVPYNG